MALFAINVTINPAQAVQGANAVQNQLDRLERRASNLQKLFGQIFVGFSVVGGIKSAIELADSYQNVENRLKAVGEANADVGRTQDELTEIANRSRSSFLSTAALYTRLIVSSKELGRTQGELLQFTERLNKTIILSGATAKEAAQSTIQLSQGLASGALRGDELRSVLEGLPAVADVIARGLGVTRGELRKLGEQGKITGQAIIDAFQKLGPEIEERFGRTIPTLGESFVVLGNQIGQFLDSANDATGFLAALSKTVLKFGEAVEFATGATTAFQSQVRTIEKEGGLASVGAIIQSLQRDLKELEGRKVISEGAAERIAELKRQLEEFQNLAKKSTVGKTPQDVEAEAAAREAERKALIAQKTTLESIRGPQEQYALRLAALNTLLQEGKITQQEYDQALEKAGDKLKRSFGEDSLKAFNDQLKALQDGNDVLRTRILLGEEAAENLEIEQSLAARGITLSQDQADLIAKEIAAKTELTKIEKEENDLREKKEALVKKEAEGIESLIVQIDVAAAIAKEEAQLNEVLRQRPDLINQVSERMDDLRLRALEASTSFGDGFERAFIKIKREAEDLAAVGEDVVNVFADRATDALVEFAQTGQLNFKEFANAILADLARILARLLIIQALNATLGGGGTAGAAAVGAGVNLAGSRAEGGPVTTGRSYLVGENGPEIFTPTQSGGITPNGAMPTAPELKVQIVNVTDPKMVPDAISGGLADQAIINVLSRNKDSVKQVLS